MRSFYIFILIILKRLYNIVCFSPTKNFLVFSLVILDFNVSARQKIMSESSLRVTLWKRTLVYLKKYKKLEVSKVLSSILYYEKIRRYLLVQINDILNWRHISQSLCLLFQMELVPVVKTLDNCCSFRKTNLTCHIWKKVRWLRYRFPASLSPCENNI